MRIAALGSHVEVFGAPGDVVGELRDRLTLPNPRYIGAVKAGRVPIGIDKDLRYYSTTPDSGAMVIPAACAGLAVGAAKQCGVEYTLDVDVREMPPVGMAFRGDLRWYQLGAVAELARYDHGVLDAPTGSGKTVMGCARIADLDQPTMIVVHNRMLQSQWMDAVEQWLGIIPHRIGGVGRGLQVDIWAVPYIGMPPVTIAIINSLAKVADVVAPHIGHLVGDEIHRCASRVWQSTLGRFDARYRTGLSATTYRSDGLDEVIQWTMGRITRVERSGLVESGAVLPARIIQRSTEFVTSLDASSQYQAVIEELVTDDIRNRQIAHEVQTHNGKLTIVLSDRVEHCERLAGLIGVYLPTVLMHGKLGAKAARQSRDVVAAGNARVIVATTQLLGEGFDLPVADVMLLATPIKFSGRLLQVLGRVLRPSDGKREGRLVDMCDWRVGVLAAAARARAKTYNQLARDERGE